MSQGPHSHIQGDGTTRLPRFLSLQRGNLPIACPCQEVFLEDELKNMKNTEAARGHQMHA